MVANRTDPPRPGGDAGKGAAPAPEPAAKEAAAAAPAKKGGLGPWLPLIVAIVLMPVLAFVMTSFVIIPKLERSMGKDTATTASEKPGKGSAAAEKKAGAEAKKKGGHGTESVSKKVNVPLKKVLVNVAGTQGTRFLVVNMTLSGESEGLKDSVEANMDQLSDLASSVLSSKTIADLEKAGARNLIRAELISVFNTVLGNDAVTEIYFTEFAVQ